MFTGLVGAVGVIQSQQRHTQNHQTTHITLSVNTSIEHIVLGESIAVNGVCLTVAAISPIQNSHFKHTIAFDISPETCHVTALGQLQVGQCVNLEQALKVSDRMGGHFVSGHVDTLAYISEMVEVDAYMTVTIAGFETHQMRYLAKKGSVAIDGVSLTINKVLDNAIQVMIIPHTLNHTTLSAWQPQQKVNIEFDYIARVVVHQLGYCQDSTIMSHFKSEDESSEVEV